MPVDVLRPAFERCAAAGYLTYRDGQLDLTTRGLAEFDRISAAWRDWLARELADWQDVGDDEFRRALDQAAREFVVGEDVGQDVAKV